MNSAGHDADPKQGSTGPAAQQLAELHLLTRANHAGTEFGPLLVRGDTALMLDIAEESSDDDVQETRPDTTDPSSFAARLAASRRLAGASSTTVESASTSSADGRPDSPRHDLPILESWPSRATTLPTLCEEADDPATDDGPEENAQAYRGDGRQVHEYTEASFVGEEDYVVKQEAFEQMLEQLSYDTNSLALSIADLSPPNLLRVRDAIAQCIPLTTNRGGPEESPLPRMRIVRTMLAIDTLRQFWLRYGKEEVIDAVTNAIARVDEQCVSGQAHSRGVLTMSNITRVVLLVRDSLKKEQCHAVQPLVDNNTAERSSPSRSRRGHGSPPKSCNASPSSWYTCRSPSSSYPSSPSYRGPTPSRSTIAASPCSPASSTSSSSLRRSILASDGAHVLMSEKLAMYQHRGDMNRLPSFKVRRQSDDTTEEAMRRRQRSIQYSSKVTKTLHGYT